MSSKYAAALFLLTADEQLWRIAQKGAIAISHQFGQMKLHNIYPDAYALYQTAKTLYTGRESITLAELSHCAGFHQFRANRTTLFYGQKRRYDVAGG